MRFPKLHLKRLKSTLFETLCSPSCDFSKLHFFLDFRVLCYTTITIKQHRPLPIIFCIKRLILQSKDIFNLLTGMEYHLPGLTRRGSSPTPTSVTPTRRRPWTTNNSIEATCLMKKNLPAAFQNLRRPSSRILKNLPTQPASIYYHHQRSEDC